jgi:hypothetical protein
MAASSTSRPFGHDSMSLQRMRRSYPASKPSLSLGSTYGIRRTR